MDYSSLPNDPDHPPGTSPWASSSPRPDRTSFPPPGSADVIPSPLPSQRQSPYGADHDREARPDSPSPFGGDDDDQRSRDLSDRLKSAHLGESDNVEQPSYNAQQAQLTQNQKAHAPARYQTGARQNAKPSAPQYKLQAKITALERTGKKDPILRFDVHVCTDCPRSGVIVVGTISSNYEY
jgi:hypothetical protein